MRMDRRVRAELHHDRLRARVDFEQVQRLTEDAQPMTVDQRLRGQRQQAETVN